MNEMNLSKLRNKSGVVISRLGFAILYLIPLSFFLQFFGIINTGIEIFGTVIYAFILFITISLGLGLIFLGIKVSNVKQILSIEDTKD